MVWPELTFGVGVQAVVNLARLMKGDGMSAFSACKYFLSCRCGWTEKTSIGLDLEPEHEGGTSAREILMERLAKLHAR